MTDASIASERVELAVGVVVIHYESYAKVLSVVDAVRTQTVAPARIVIIDNASPDGSGPRLVEHFRQDPMVTVIVAPTNGGYAAAFNIAHTELADSGVDAVLVLTHDAILARDALEVLLDELASDPTVGAIGPLLSLSEDPEVIWSAGGRIDDELLRPRPINVPRETALWTDRAPHEVQWLDGAAVLYREDALQRVGPMDERYFLYYEDVDYGTVLRGRGWRLLCVPRARATQSVGTQSRYLAQRNYLRYVHRHGSQSQRRRAFVVEVRLFFSDVLRSSLRRSSVWWIGGFYLGDRAAGLRDYALRRFGPPRNTRRT